MELMSRLFAASLSLWAGSCGVIPTITCHKDPAVSCTTLTQIVGNTQPPVVYSALLQTAETDNTALVGGGSAHAIVHGRKNRGGEATGVMTASFSGRNCL